MQTRVIRDNKGVLRVWIIVHMVIRLEVGFVLVLGFPKR